MLANILVTSYATWLPEIKKFKYKIIFFPTGEIQNMCKSSDIQQETLCNITNEKLIHLLKNLSTLTVK